MTDLIYFMGEFFANVLLQKNFFISSFQGLICKNGVAMLYFLLK